MMTRHFMDIRANLSEGQGGLIRILTDAERFGLVVQRLDLEPAADQAAGLHLSATFVTGATEIDATQLAARFARHAGVTMVTCRERSHGPIARLPQTRRSGWPQRRR